MVRNMGRGGCYALHFLLLNWLTNEQVVRWIYEESASWDMNKIVEQFAEKTKEFHYFTEKSLDK